MAREESFCDAVFEEMNILFNQYRAQEQLKALYASRAHSQQVPAHTSQSRRGRHRVLDLRPSRRRDPSQLSSPARQAHNPARQQRRLNDHTGISNSEEHPPTAYAPQHLDDDAQRRLNQGSSSDSSLQPGSSHTSSNLPSKKRTATVDASVQHPRKHTKVTTAPSFATSADRKPGNTVKERIDITITRMHNGSMEVTSTSRSFPDNESEQDDPTEDNGLADVSSNDAQSNSSCVSGASDSEEDQEASDAHPKPVHLTQQPFIVTDSFEIITSRQMPGKSLPSFISVEDIECDGTTKEVDNSDIKFYGEFEENDSRRSYGADAETESDSDDDELGTEDDVSESEDEENSRGLWFSPISGRMVRGAWHDLVILE